LRQLEQHGHEVTFRSASDSKGNKTPVTLRDMQGYDVILGQRFNTHRGLDTWRRARTPLSRLVYETDDDVFSVTAENFQAYHLFSRPEVRDAVTHMAEVADLITVTTGHLAQVMREQTGNGSVAVLPNCIPAWILDLPSPRNRRPVIGWQGGASHGVDVGLIVGPVRRFLKRFPGWDFRLGGTDYRPTFEIGDRADFRPWVPVYEDPEGYYATIDFDIGLAPLVVNDFAKSKSNIKVLEYAARGIPSVATDCEVYRSFIRHGENGFLVKRDHEWLHYLSILAADDSLRLAMGKAARDDAAALTIEGNWVRWQDAYASLFRSLAVG
jgi:glycosyltransferase involved in cell wall biosynthesis